MNADALNQVKNLIVNFANKQGINLQEEFGTPAKFKEFVIALTFKGLTDAGATTEQAFDLIFGNGEYDALVERTWQAAQAN